MDSEELKIRTGDRLVTDLTQRVERFCDGRGDGLVHVFVPHATAGVALLELGSGSDRDLVEVLSRLLPRDDRWTHRHGAEGPGADHLLPVFVSPSLSIPVLDGRLALGTWQRVVIVDPNRQNNERRVMLSFLGGTETA